ncbi:hypothetical protein BD289DRAFT_509416 [Coniella lustricola]|uniref:Uncharacterized protein n=1 Tax=Coniella lustricola TaxID=2025994 RepID=A0A2T2ZUZ2_9PEZI|nr:hypothetical protein BD289DRAFT_509416 [Coniella lustricola]
MPACTKLSDSPYQQVIHLFYNCDKLKKGLVECRNPVCKSYGKHHDFKRWPTSATLANPVHLWRALSGKNKRPGEVTSEAPELAPPAKRVQTDSAQSIPTLGNSSQSISRPAPSNGFNLEPLWKLILELQGDSATVVPMAELLGNIPMPAELGDDGERPWPAPFNSVPQPRYTKQCTGLPPVNTTFTFGSDYATPYASGQIDGGFHSATDSSPQSLITTSSAGSQQTQLTTPFDTCPPDLRPYYKQESFNCFTIPEQSLASSFQNPYMQASGNQAMNTTDAYTWYSQSVASHSMAFEDSIVGTHAMMPVAPPGYRAQQHYEQSVSPGSHAQLLHEQNPVLPDRNKAYSPLSGTNGITDEWSSSEDLLDVTGKSLQPAVMEPAERSQEASVIFETGYTNKPDMFAQEAASQMPRSGLL